MEITPQTHALQVGIAVGQRHHGPAAAEVFECGQRILEQIHALAFIEEHLESGLGQRRVLACLRERQTDGLAAQRAQVMPQIGAQLIHARLRMARSAGLGVQRPGGRCVLGQPGLQDGLGARDGGPDGPWVSSRSSVMARMRPRSRGMKGMCKKRWGASAMTNREYPTAQALAGTGCRAASASHQRKPLTHDKKNTVRYLDNFAVTSRAPCSRKLQLSMVLSMVALFAQLWMGQVSQGTWRRCRAVHAGDICSGHGHGTADDLPSGHTMGGTLAAGLQRGCSQFHAWQFPRPLRATARAGGLRRTFTSAPPGAAAPMRLPAQAPGRLNCCLTHLVCPGSPAAGIAV